MTGAARNADSRRIEEHLRALTVDIGVRLAGSAAEEQAAAYVRDRFTETGAETWLESFPMRERAVARQELQVRVGDSWRDFPCSLFCGTPGTEGKPIEAPLCFFEAPAEYRRPSLSHLKGKAVVHLGCHIESRESYRRLIEAEPAFLMFVDVRYPGTTPLADGMFPAYVEALGAKPVVNVAYMDAWDWKVSGASAARLTVEGGVRPAQSANVVAEFAGSAPDGGLLILGAHHDTQADSVGADDNAVGVAALLELARMLAGTGRLEQTVRLISFGTEEQLSVGSAAYVRRHRAELANRGRFVLNFDSIGSHLGWTELISTGTSDMADWLLGVFDRHDVWLKPNHDVVPYLDSFPFAAAGIPNASLLRSNCTGGRFFHHRPDDDMTRVSTQLAAELVTCSGRLFEELAAAREMPFGDEIPKEQAEPVRVFWEDLFGGWGGAGEG